MTCTFVIPAIIYISLPDVDTLLKKRSIFIHVQIFNSWEVEAPRYGDLCDWHYSCLQSENDRMLMKGEVGEAVTRHLITWLVKTME